MCAVHSYQSSILLRLQVRGVDSLKAFAPNLITPYTPKQSTPATALQVKELEQQVADLKAQLEEAKKEIARLGKK